MSQKYIYEGTRVKELYPQFKKLDRPVDEIPQKIHEELIDKYNQMLYEAILNDEVLSIELI